MGKIPFRVSEEFSLNRAKPKKAWYREVRSQGMKQTSRKWRRWNWRTALYGGSLVFNIALLAMIVVASFAPRIVAREAKHYARHTEIGCLAMNTYRERAIAGKEFPTASTDDEMMAFAWVVKNRLAIGFHQSGQAVPTSLCDVVWAGSEKATGSAFSWTTEDWKYHVSERYMPDFYRAFRAAAAVMAETPEAMAVKARIGDADHYLNVGKVLEKRGKLPGWATRMEPQRKVGYHTFLTERGRFEDKRGLNEALAAMGM